MLLGAPHSGGCTVKPIYELGDRRSAVLYVRWLKLQAPIGYLNIHLLEACHSRNEIGLLFPTEFTHPVRDGISRVNEAVQGLAPIPASNVNAKKNLPTVV